MFEFDESIDQTAKIKVIGVGGGGGNAVNTMILSHVEGVEFVAANTDAQALNTNRASMKIQLVGKLTKGLGAGANPEVGREAALEDRAALAQVLQGVDLHDPALSWLALQRKCGLRLTAESTIG